MLLLVAIPAKENDVQIIEYLILVIFDMMDDNSVREHGITNCTLHAAFLLPFDPDEKPASFPPNVSFIKVLVIVCILVIAKPFCRECIEIIQFSRD